MRTLEGCEKFEDVPDSWEIPPAFTRFHPLPVPSTIGYIKQMFKGFGVKEEDGDLWVDSNKSLKELKARQSEIAEKSKEMNRDGIDHLILVYCRGHACSFGEELNYLCNSDNGK